MDPLTYKIGNSWLISWAFGIPDTESDHIESKLLSIIKNPGTKRNLSQIYKHWKQFSYTPKLKLSPKVNADPTVIRLPSPGFCFVFFFHLHIFFDWESSLIKYRVLYNYRNQDWSKWSYKVRRKAELYIHFTPGIKVDNLICIGCYVLINLCDFTISLTLSYHYDKKSNSGLGLWLRGALA